MRASRRTAAHHFAIPALLALGLGLGLASGAAAQSNFYYVELGAGGAGTCDDPFGTIAEAVAAVSADGGDGEIRIAGAPGGIVYPESGITIDVSNVWLKGGYDAGTWAGPCDPVTIEGMRTVPADPSRTIIDAGGTERIFDILPVTDGATGDFLATNTNINVDGLEMRNGQPSASGSAGAMLIRNCEVAVSNSTFRANRSRGHFAAGGAVYVLGYYTATTGTFNRAGLDLRDTLFVDNSTGDGINGSGIGGAIFAADGNSTMTGATRMTSLNAVTTPDGFQPMTFRRNTSAGGGVLDPMVCMDELERLNADCQPAAMPDGVADTCTHAASGGAIFAQNVSGTWDGVIFDQNVSRARPFPSAVDFSGQGGAATIIASGSPNQANPVITNSVFNGNQGQAGGAADPASTACTGGYQSWGGAIYTAGFDQRITGSDFINNVGQAGGNNGVLNSWGGAVNLAFSQGTPVVADNNFQGNQAVSGAGQFSGWGGGFFAFSGQPVVTGNTFSQNLASGGGPGGGYGGAIAGFALTGAYTEFSNNDIIMNTASGAPTGGNLRGMGGGFHLQTFSPTSIISDNIVVGNSGTTVVGPLRFSGAVINTSLGFTASTTSQTLVQNNLIAESDGVGLLLLGFAGATNFQVATPLFNNTITNNAFGGLFLSNAIDASIDSSIVWGNDTSATGLGDIADILFTDAPPSSPFSITNSILGVLPDPADSPDLVMSAQSPNNNNRIGVNPVFTRGPSAVAPDYYLDQSVMPRVSVDGSLIAAPERTFGGPRDGRIYDLNGDGRTDTMGDRTTAPSESPDLCFMDIGFHYQIGAPAVDSDGDGIPDAMEATLGTDPNDADTDDDGVPDGIDCDPGCDLDGDGVIDTAGDCDSDGLPGPLDCDSDNDGLPDGLERGFDMPVGDGNGDGFPDTDETATCDTSAAPCGDPASPSFIPDADPTTTTDHLDPDTDDGGETDGCEDDVMRNGRIDNGVPPMQSPCVPDGDPPREQNPNLTTDDDADGDCLTAQLEGFLGTNPDDADTDDDGRSDGAELGFDPRVVPTIITSETTCDSDGDGLPDGLEVGIDAPIPDDPDGNFLGTDLAAGCFIADVEPATTTDPNEPDTDGDGCVDGIEDFDPTNGTVDGADTDPNAVDCSPPGVTLFSDSSITALVGGGNAPCGLKTLDPVQTFLTTPCDMPLRDPLPMPPMGTRMVGGTDMGTLPFMAPGGAASGSGSPLVFYAADDAVLIEVLKEGAGGNDLLVQERP